MGLLKELRGEYLDLTFRLRRGELRIRIVEKPGIWMSPEECAALVQDLRGVVRSMKKGDLDYGVVSGDPERLRSTVITVIYECATGRPIAFNALPILTCVLRGRVVTVHHLGLVVIDPASRNRGLSGTLYLFAVALLFVRNRLKPIWISNVTQVPAVFGLVAQNFSSVFPSALEDAHRSFDHVVLARQIFHNDRSAFGVGADAGFDERRFVIKDAYRGGSDNLKKSFAEAPKHRNPLYNDWCQRELDYDRGDDFLQVGRLNIRAFTNYLYRDLPEGTLAAFGFQFFRALLQRLVFPLIYWFDASHTLGDLRPWTVRQGKDSGDPV